MNKFDKVLIFSLSFIIIIFIIFKIIKNIDQKKKENFIVDWVEDTVNDIGDGISEGGRFVVNTANDAADEVRDTAIEVTNELSEVAEELGNDLAQAATSLYNELSELDSFTDIITGPLDTLLSEIPGAPTTGEIITGVLELAADTGLPAEIVADAISQGIDLVDTGIGEAVISGREFGNIIYTLGETVVNGGNVFDALIDARVGLFHLSYDTLSRALELRLDAKQIIGNTAIDIYQHKHSQRGINTLVVTLDLVGVPDSVTDEITNFDNLRNDIIDTVQDYGNQGLDNYQSLVRAERGERRESLVGQGFEYTQRRQQLYGHIGVEIFSLDFVVATYRISNHISSNLEKAETFKDSFMMAISKPLTSLRNTEYHNLMVEEIVILKRVSNTYKNLVDATNGKLNLHSILISNLGENSLYISPWFGPLIDNPNNLLNNTFSKSQFDQYLFTTTSLCCVLSQWDFTSIPNTRYMNRWYINFRGNPARRNLRYLNLESQKRNLIFDYDRLYSLLRFIDVDINSERFRNISSLLRSRPDRNTHRQSDYAISNPPTAEEISRFNSIGLNGVLNRLYNGFDFNLNQVPRFFKTRLRSLIYIEIERITNQFSDSEDSLGWEYHENTPRNKWNNYDTISIVVPDVSSINVDKISDKFLEKNLLLTWVDHHRRYEFIEQVSQYSLDYNLYTFEKSQFYNHRNQDIWILSHRLTFRNVGRSYTRQFLLGQKNDNIFRITMSQKKDNNLQPASHGLYRHNDPPNLEYDIVEAIDIFATADIFYLDTNNDNEYTPPLYNLPNLNNVRDRYFIITKDLDKDFSYSAVSINKFNNEETGDRSHGFWTFTFIENNIWKFSYKDSATDESYYYSYTPGTDIFSGDWFESISDVGSETNKLNDFKLTKNKNIFSSHNTFFLDLTDIRLRDTDDRIGNRFYTITLSDVNNIIFTVTPDVRSLAEQNSSWVFSNETEDIWKLQYSYSQTVNIQNIYYRLNIDSEEGLSGQWYMTLDEARSRINHLENIRLYTLRPTMLDSYNDIFYLTTGEITGDKFDRLKNRIYTISRDTEGDNLFIAVPNNILSDEEDVSNWVFNKISSRIYEFRYSYMTYANVQKIYFLIDSYTSLSGSWYKSLQDAENNTNSLENVRISNSLPTLQTTNPQINQLQTMQTLVTTPQINQLQTMQTLVTTQPQQLTPFIINYDVNSNFILSFKNYLISFNYDIGESNFIGTSQLFEDEFVYKIEINENNNYILNSYYNNNFVSEIENVFNGVYYIFF